MAGRAVVREHGRYEAGMRTFLTVTMWSHGFFYTHTHSEGPLLSDRQFIQSWPTRELLVTTETGSRTTRALWDGSVPQHVDLPLLIDDRVNLFASLPTLGSFSPFHFCCFAGCLFFVALFLITWIFPPICALRLILTETLCIGMTMTYIALY